MVEPATFVENLKQNTFGGRAVSFRAVLKTTPTQEWPGDDVDLLALLTKPNQCRARHQDEPFGHHCGERRAVVVVRRP